MRRDPTAQLLMPGTNITYYVDLELMVQVNGSTGYRRLVRRTPVCVA